MSFSSDNYDKFRLTRRLAPLYIFFMCFLLLVFGRVFYLQVFRGQRFQKLSEINRIKHDIIPAARGAIKDSRGQIIAADEPVPHLLKESLHSEFSDFKKRQLAAGLAMDYEKLNRRLSDPKRRYILRGMNDSQRIWFEERSQDYPGLILRVMPKRVYRYGEALASIVGYTGEIDPRELQRRRAEGLSQGDIVGKAGIERSYDHLLQGRDGLRWIEVSATGEFIRKLAEPGPINPSQGDDLDIFIDSRLQREVAATFAADSEGAAVVMEIPSGKIRALYSHPSYDPNEIVLGEEERIRELLSRETNPLHDRVNSGRFPPGSTFKLIPFMAALRESEISANKRYNCDGEFHLGGHTFRCWREEGHGRLNLRQALVHSCNVYFYKLIREMGYEPVLELGGELHYNARTGIDLPSERNSQLSSPELKKNRYGAIWTGGDAVNAVIGQGYTLITPIKQAQLLGTILTGELIRPVVGKSNGTAAPRQKVDISSEHRSVLIESMDQITSRGTGYWARHDDYWRRLQPDVIGKTGTVQKIKRNDDEDTPAPDAWFVSAAPRDNPRYVVVVFLIEAGMGGQVAAPHARDIYQIMRRLGYFDETVASQPAGRAAPGQFAFTASLSSGSADYAP